MLLDPCQYGPSKQSLNVTYQKIDSCFNICSVVVMSFVLFCFVLFFGLACSAIIGAKAKGLKLICFGLTS